MIKNKSHLQKLQQNYDRIHLKSMMCGEHYFHTIERLLVCFEYEKQNNVQHTISLKFFLPSVVSRLVTVVM